MVKLGRIFDNACRLCGREPTLLAPPAGWDVLAAMTLSAGLRTLAAEKFPMMQRIEVRRYRPEWSADVAYTSGQEVWHNGEYWRTDRVTQGDEPGANGVWRRLEAGEVWAFIHWRQPWENTEIDSAGVDINRFAYAADPKYHPNVPPLKCTGMFEYGVEIAAPAPKEVYVKFVPVFPQISFTPWSDKVIYSAGETVYRPSVGDVFRCKKDLTAEEQEIAPESAEAAELWEAVRVRGEFEPYLTRLVAADLMTDEQAKGMSRAAADRELEMLCERYHEGNGETRMRLGRFR